MATEADSVGRVTVMKRIVAIILFMILVVGCAKIENDKAKGANRMQNNNISLCMALLAIGFIFGIICGYNL